MHSIIRCQVNRFNLLRSIIASHSKQRNSIAANSALIQPSKSYCASKPYKAAILEEFNKKLVIGPIKNRAELGQGMVYRTYFFLYLIQLERTYHCDLIV